MKKDAFFVAYVLCASLVRGPEYIDAMTDPHTYQTAQVKSEALPGRLISLNETLSAGES